MNTPSTQQDEAQTSKRTAVGARRLSTQPGVLAMLYAVVVAYGSLIPFVFDWSGAVAESGGAFAALRDALMSPNWITAREGTSSLGVSFVISDVVVNLLLYVPLGVMLRMALRSYWWSRGPGWAVQVGLTALAGFALSWSLESLQGLMPARYSSANDVILNTGGALLGALLAAWFWSAVKAVAFTLHCRLSSAGDRVRCWLARPGVVMLIALFNAGVIGWWYVIEVRRSGAGSNSVAMPFEHVFKLPYDLAAVLLGEMMLAYAGLGCLLLLLTYSGSRRLAMNWVVLGVVLIAFAAEAARAATHDAAPDITGPLLALAAAAIMSVTVYTFAHAVKRANRRHQDRRYAGPDRRRRPHDYT